MRRFANSDALVVVKVRGDRVGAAQRADVALPRQLRLKAPTPALSTTATLFCLHLLELHQRVCLVVFPASLITSASPRRKHLDTLNYQDSVSS